MPLVWKFDPAESAVVAVANGDVTRIEVERYLDALVAEEALAYRKVFDVSLGDTSMTAADVLPLAVRMRLFQDMQAMGPLAVILPKNRGKRLQQALGMLAVAKRPMRVFEEASEAYIWISKQPIPAHGTTVKIVGITKAQSRQLATRIRLMARDAGLAALSAAAGS